MNKVAIINASFAYVNLFKDLGFEVISDVKTADLVVFTGGEDVTPALYGDEQHWTTGNNPRRDEMEKHIFEKALSNNIPMVGICRGAQFLNVMSGGRMYQHVERHTRAHNITDVETGAVIYVSSTHHQIMLPSEDAITIATANQGGSREWFDGAIARKDVSNTDIEVVYYPKTRCLCFQPHPEFTGAEYLGMKKYFESLVERYLVQVAA